MPDRIVRGRNVTVPIAGLNATFTPPFKEEPTLAVTVQDGATDDRIEITAKTNAGFTIKVYNATSAAYVSRVVDWIATGYGRGT